MNEIKKVLVVDDSAFMRRVISDIINNDPRCKVVGTAINGKDALVKIKELELDVISLDIQMPIMDGLEMLRQLNKIKPIPVVIMSSLTKKGAKETLDALELGAFDFVKKPDNIFAINMDEILEELLTKLILASEAGRKNINIPLILSETNKYLEAKKHTKKYKGETANKLIAIGTSTGGPRALQYVLPYMPNDIEAGIVIVQHMPPGFTLSLAKRLDQLSNIDVKEAEDGDIIEKGKAYIAPGNKHLLVKEKSNGVLYIKLDDAPPYGGHKPAVNIMMKSISNLKQRPYIGVIMTGMGGDGTEGLKEIKTKSNIHIIAQNKESCIVYGMPKVAIEAGIVDEIVPLDQIANTIIKKMEVL